MVLNHPREAYRSALTGCLAVPRFSQSPAAAAVSAPPPLDSLGPFGCMMEKRFRFSKGLKKKTQETPTVESLT